MKTHKYCLPVIYWLTLLTFVVSGCFGSNQFVSLDPAAAKVLVFPPADYSYLVQRGQETLAFVSNIESNRSDTTFKYSEEGKPQFFEISFPQNSKCEVTAYSIDDSLPNGNLQVRQLCRSTTQASTSAVSTLTYLMSYDWSSQAVSEISGPLPLGTTAASWNPNGSIAIADLDSGYSSRTLYWLWSGGYKPLDLVLGDGERMWNLKDDFPDFRAAETGKSGIAGRGAWSPKGDQIAFFASSDAIGKVLEKRFAAVYSLYLMDPNQLRPSPVLSEIYYPFIIKWSPDSKYIAFVGDYTRIGESGVWLYSREAKTVTRVDEGDFQDIAWSATGRSIIAIKCAGVLNCGEILQYDLHSVLGTN